MVLGKRGRGDVLNVVRRAREMIPADDPVLCFNWYPHVVAQLAVPQLAADRTVRWYPVGRRRHRRPAILRSPGATLGRSGRGLPLGCGETGDRAARLAEYGLRVHPDAVYFPNELGEKPGGPSWPRPYLLSVGRLGPEKDHETLLRSFALLSSQLEHDLVVAGDGPNLDRLKKIVSASGLDERVHFVGYRRDIPALMEGPTCSCIPRAGGIRLCACRGDGARHALRGDRRALRSAFNRGTGTRGRARACGRCGAVAREVLRLLGDEPERRRLAAIGVEACHAISPQSGS